MQKLYVLSFLFSFYWALPPKNMHKWNASSRGNPLGSPPLRSGAFPAGTRRCRSLSLQDSELRLRAKAAFSQDAAVCRCAVTCHAFKRHRKSFCSCASTMTFPPMSNWLTGDARRSFSCPTKTPCPTQWALNCQQSSSVNAKFIFKIK